MAKFFDAYFIELLWILGALSVACFIWAAAILGEYRKTRRLLQRKRHAETFRDRLEAWNDDQP